MELFTLIYLFSCMGFAASPATPPVILGTTKAAVTGALSGSSVVQTPTNTANFSQTYELDAALSLNPLLQTGFAMPMTSHEVTMNSQNASTTRPNDLRLYTGYLYSIERKKGAKPDGVLFLQMTLPLAHCSYDAFETNGVDGIGGGFYSASVGTVISKSWALWDANLTPEFHYSLPREFSKVTVTPGVGGSLSFGAGRNFKGFPIRVGAVLQPDAEEARYDLWRTKTPSEEPGSLEWNAVLTVSYIYDAAWVLTASYSDETLISPSPDSSMSRTVGLALQRHWL